MYGTKPRVFRNNFCASSKEVSVDTLMKKETIRIEKYDYEYRSMSTLRAPSGVSGSLRFHTRKKISTSE